MIDALGATAMLTIVRRHWTTEDREPRVAHGRKVVRTPLLFPGYLFVFIQLQ